MLIISFRDRNFKYCPGTGPLSLSSLSKKTVVRSYPRIRVVINTKRPARSGFEPETSWIQ